MTNIPLIVQADTSSVVKGKGDLEGFKRALGGVQQGQDEGARSGRGYTEQMVAGSRATAGMASQLAKLKTVAGLAALAAGAYVVAKAIAEAGDAASQAENRLNALGLNGRDTYDGLAESATRLGVETKSVVDTFARFALVRGEIGLTSGEVQTLTENVIALGLQSGASAQETASASVQLAQALASGVLQGDELRSILESAPALAKALADGLGVSVGELRTLGSEGKLVAADLANILVDLKVDPSGFDSIAQAQTRIKNELDRVLVNLDRALNLSGLWRTVLNGVADGLGLIADGVESGGDAIDYLSGVWKEQTTAFTEAERAVNELNRKAELLQYWFAAVSRDATLAQLAVQELAKEGVGGVTASVEGLAAALRMVRAEALAAKAAAVPVSATRFAAGPPTAAEAKAIADATPRYITPPTVDIPGTGTGTGSGAGSGGGGGGSSDSFRREQAETLKAAADAQNLLNEAMRGGSEATEEYAKAQERAETMARLLQSAREEGITLSAKEVEALEDALLAQDRLTEKAEEIKQAYDAIKDAAGEFGSATGKALADSLFGIGNFNDALKASFKDLVSTILSELGKLAANQLLLMLIGGAGGSGGGFNLFGGGGGGLKIPGFASGGYHSGGLRVVGENGPEIEATGASRIHSSASLGEMVKPKVSVSVNVINNAGVQVETMEQPDGSIDVVINAASRHTADGIARGTSDVSRVLEQTYGLTRRGR